MELLALAVGLLAVVALGLSAGALLAEAGVLVPMWRRQAPADFLRWYAEHAALLLRFFGPLEVASGALVVAATFLAWLTPGRGEAWFGLATLLTVAVLASFPLYFQRANASFEQGSIPTEDVGAELARWAAWHRGRTAIAIGAFLAAAWGFAQQASGAA